MKQLPLFIITLLALLITGCSSSTGHMYTADGKCITCFNNPLTGDPLNHEGDQKQKDANSVDQANTLSETTPKAVVASKFIEHKISFSVPVNVDVAYIKIKKEFSYYSEQETRQEWGSMATAKMQTFAYAYEAMPSVRYRMRAARDHNNQRFVIDSEIEKETLSSTKIILTYWSNKTSFNEQAYSESLKQRVLKSLNI